MYRIHIHTYRIYSHIFSIHNCKIENHQTIVQFDIDVGSKVDKYNIILTNKDYSLK